MKLNKKSPIPLYYQLADQIKDRIQAGELRAGDQLPSERELGELAGISRMTVRQAMAYLVREGALEVKAGVGTFIAKAKMTYDLLHLLGFTEEVIRQGGTVTSQVLEQATVSAPPSIAAGLNLKAGEEVVKIIRLRLVGDTPLLLETTFIPIAICPDLDGQDLSAKSLYTVLESQYGLRLKRTKQTLEATVATVYEGQLFNREPGTAMILLEGVTYLDQEQPVEYFKAIYRGDRFKFELESQRDASPAMSSASKVRVLFK